MSLSKHKTNDIKNELIRRIQSSQFKEAEMLYSYCEGQEIYDADLWRYFAGVHKERGNLNSVVECCKNIIRINPDDFQTVFNLGATLQQLNQTEEAIAQYEKCIDANSDFTNAYVNCAFLYHQTGNIKKSATYYSKALEQTDTEEIRIQYGEILISSGKYENAIKQFEISMSDNPTNVKTMFLIAQCYFSLKNYVYSKKYYLQCCSLDKQNVTTINNLGQCYDELGQFEESIEQYHKAISLKPDISIIYRNLGVALTKIGKVDEAENALIKSMELDPLDPGNYFYLGKVYNEKGGLDKAKQYFTKALSLVNNSDTGEFEELTKSIKYHLSVVIDPDSFGDVKKEFITDLFDRYAESFNEDLVDKLNYIVPEYINDALDKHVRKLNNVTIDLGCGTGLCCQYLKGRSSSVTGVDLSPKMIEKSRKLECYDDLIVGEISEVVNASDKIFDLIIAADVFVYLGSLVDIFDACTKKISNNGYFMFSNELLEHHEETGYRQYDSGRFKHSINYIETLSIKYDFSVIEHIPCNIRNEYREKVKGYVSVLRKK